MKQLLLTLGLLSLVAVTVTRGQDGGGHGNSQHVAVRPDAIKWGAGPPSLPPGAQFAVLVGDPSKSGSYVFRVKMPDGFRVPPHWHPTDENVSVLQGTLLMGMGEKFDVSKTEALTAGSFMCMPKNMRHFAAGKG